MTIYLDVSAAVHRRAGLGRYAESLTRVLVFPGLYEGFGLPVLEPMACGKPVACTELGTGISYVNIDGLTGLVVPPRAPAKAAGAIERLLSDPGLGEEMGQQAKEQVEKGFSHERMVESILALYEEVLST